MNRPHCKMGAGNDHCSSTVPIVLQLCTRCMELEVLLLEATRKPAEAIEWQAVLHENKEIGVASKQKALSLRAPTTDVAVDHFEAKHTAWAVVSG